MNELSSRGLPTRKEMKLLESFVRDQRRKERERREREEDTPTWDAFRARGGK